MISEHIKGLAESIVKDADGNPTTPEKMHVERKLEEAKRVSPDEARSIEGGIRLPARSAKNEPPSRF